jgi:hypothetical protein
MKTHEVAPALFVIHEAAAVLEAIQGGNAQLSDRFCTPCRSKLQRLYRRGGCRQQNYNSDQGSHQWPASSRRLTARSTSSIN